MSRLEEIKKVVESQKEAVRKLSYNDLNWLIKQAEIQQETEQMWMLIENSEIDKEPDDFYTAYQDIALKHYGLDY